MQADHNYPLPALVNFLDGPPWPWERGEFLLSPQCRVVIWDTRLLRGYDLPLRYSTSPERFLVGKMAALFHGWESLGPWSWGCPTQEPSNRTARYLLIPSAERPQRKTECTEQLATESGPWRTLTDSASSGCQAKESLLKRSWSSLTGSVPGTYSAPISQTLPALTQPRANRSCHSVAARCVCVGSMSFHTTPLFQEPHPCTTARGRAQVMCAVAVVVMATHCGLWKRQVEGLELCPLGLHQGIGG